MWSRDKGENIDYCVVNELAALLWAVNIGSIELHTSLHLRRALERPTVLAFDLDPGERTGILDCCWVALRLRDLFASVELACYPKTSGSKGLQVYVPLNSEASYRMTKPLSRRVAELLEGQTPEAVVSRMARSQRAGRVLVDWSQNTEHKSMVCAYSVRAKDRPTVSTPVATAGPRGRRSCRRGRRASADRLTRRGRVAARRRAGSASGRASRRADARKARARAADRRLPLRAQVGRVPLHRVSQRRCGGPQRRTASSSSANPSRSRS